MKNKKYLYYFAAYFVLYEMTTYLSNDMIMPAMPQIVKQFHVSLDNIALSLTFFIIGGSSLQVFLGPVADLIGKRKVLLFGNCLFLIATLVIPFSQSINYFLWARFFQGMGMCFIFIGYAMIHELFDDVGAVKLMAIMTNIAIFAPLAGPVIGAAITVASRWEYVFIISGILGCISLIGLYKYMPQGEIHTTKIDVKQIIVSYKKIITDKTFLLGMTGLGLSVIPFVSWIGISPATILENQHQPFKVYVIYQCIIFSGFVISSMIANQIAGRVSFYNLIRVGGILSFTGLFTGGILCWVNTPLVIASMSLYAFGLGLYNGSLFRIIISSSGESMNLSSAVTTLVNCIFLSVGLELCNRISEVFNYSIESFAIINLCISIPVFFLIRKFAIINKERAWNTE